MNNPVDTGAAALPQSGLRLDGRQAFARSGTLLVSAALLGPFWATSLGATPSLTGGRVLLAVVVGLFALDALEHRRTLRRPGLPAVLLAIAFVGVVVWAGVNALLWGCFCAGGFGGLAEVAAATLLAVAVSSQAPRFRLPLLVAAAAGVVLGGALAVVGADLHSALASAAAEGRLSGVYGNSNSLAYALAGSVPLLLLGARVLKGRYRWLVAAALLGVLVALGLTFSRGGMLAASLGAIVALAMLAPTRRRALGVLAGGPLLLAASAAILYPLASDRRLEVEYGPAIDALAFMDRGGWDGNAQGLIPRGSASFSNRDGGRVLRIATSAAGQGVSYHWGPAQRGHEYVLRFDAKSAGDRVALRFGLEDNVLGNSPAIGSAPVASKWTQFRVSWTPSALSKFARLYIWQETGATTLLLRRVNLLQRRADGSVATTTIDTRLYGSLAAAGYSRVYKQLENDSVKQRLTGVEIAGQALLRNPLTGIGWEKFPSFVLQERPEYGRLATHNEYMRFAGELGLPGVAFLLLLVVAAALGLRACPRGFFKAAAAGTIAAGAVGLLFVNGLVVASPTLPLAVTLGVICARRGAANELPAFTWVSLDLSTRLAGKRYAFASLLTLAPPPVPLASQLRLKTSQLRLGAVGSALRAGLAGTLELVALAPRPVPLAPPVSLSGIPYRRLATARAALASSRKQVSRLLAHRPQPAAVQLPAVSLVALARLERLRFTVPAVFLLSARKLGRFAGRAFSACRSLPALAPAPPRFDPSRIVLAATAVGRPLARASAAKARYISARGELALAAIAVGALALAVRIPLFSGAYWANEDSADYLADAVTLLGEDPLGEYRTPGYPVFIAFADSIGGSPERSVLVAQHLLGVAVAVAVAVVCWRYFGRAAALLAGSLAALSPGMAYLEHFVLADFLFGVLIFAGALVLVKAVERGTLASLFLAGAVFGLATYMKPVGQFLVVAGLLPLALSTRSLKRTLAGSAVVAAGLALVIAPWILRNAAQYGHATLSTQGGQTLFNRAFERDRLAIPTDSAEGRLAQRVADRLPRGHRLNDDVLEAFTASGMTTYEALQAEGRLATQAIRANPGRYAVETGRNFWSMVKGPYLSEKDLGFQLSLAAGEQNRTILARVWSAVSEFSAIWWLLSIQTAASVLLLALGTRRSQLLTASCISVGVPVILGTVLGHGGNLRYSLQLLPMQWLLGSAAIVLVASAALNRNVKFVWREPRLSRPEKLLRPYGQEPLHGIRVLVGFATRPRPLLAGRAEGDRLILERLEGMRAAAPDPRPLALNGQATGARWAAQLRTLRPARFWPVKPVWREPRLSRPEKLSRLYRQALHGIRVLVGFATRPRPLLAGRAEGDRLIPERLEDMRAAAPDPRPLVTNGDASGAPWAAQLPALRPARFSQARTLRPPAPVPASPRLATRTRRLLGEVANAFERARRSRDGDH